MNETDIKFLEDSFKKYYFEHSNLIRVPERASEREFGNARGFSSLMRSGAVRSLNSSAYSDK